MDDNKFVLTRVKKNSHASRPVIRVTRQDYALLNFWSVQTGRSITEVAGMALRFAAAHAVLDLESEPQDDAAPTETEVE